MTTHNVNGTTFRFPELPDAEQIGFDLFERLHGSRAAVLAAAAKVKAPKPAKPRPFRGPKPGNGEFTPKPGAPGDVITHGGREFEVWSPGPYPNTRWVTHAGRFFLLRGTSALNHWVSPDPDEVLAPGVTVEWMGGFSGGVRPIITKTDVA